MGFDTIFASLATGFSDAFGGPYQAATARCPGTPTYDTGGSIIAPGTPTQTACRAQGEAATQAMRADGGFLETDIRLLVIGMAALDTLAQIEIEAGPHAGTWALMSVARDPVGVGFECRARRAT